MRQIGQVITAYYAANREAIAARAGDAENGYQETRKAGKEGEVVGGLFFDLFISG